MKNRAITSPQEAILRIMRGETLFIDGARLDPGWSQNWSITTVRRIVSQGRLKVASNAEPLNLFLTVYWPQVGDEVAQSVWFNETDAANEAKRLNLKIGFAYSHYGERPIHFEPTPVPDPNAFLPIASAPRDGSTVTIKDDEGNKRKMHFGEPFWWYVDGRAMRILDPIKFAETKPDEQDPLWGIARAEEWRQ